MCTFSFGFVSLFLFSLSLSLFLFLSLSTPEQILARFAVVQPRLQRVVKFSLVLVRGVFTLFVRKRLGRDARGDEFSLRGFGEIRVVHRSRKLRGAVFAKRTHRRRRGRRRQ